MTALFVIQFTGIQFEFYFQFQRNRRKTAAAVTISTPQHRNIETQRVEHIELNCIWLEMRK